VSEEQKQTAPKTGPGKGLVLLVVVALAVAAVLATKLYDRRQALEETIVTAPKTETPAGQTAGMPLFAPKAENGTDETAPLGVTGSNADADTSGDIRGGTASVTMRAAAPATDRVLTPDFVSDLAAFLARAYHPAGTRDNTGNRGLTTMTFKRLNMRYGVDLTGLDVDARDSATGRNQALSHLMSPIVLRLAFDILSDPFVHELADQGARQQRAFQNGGAYAKRPLRDAQVREMLKIHASLVADAGKIFRTFASRPDLLTAMRRYFQAAADVNAAYGKYADREAVGAPQKELDAISVEIKNTIQAREKMRVGLMQGATPRSGSLLSEGDVLDIAAWIYRRIKANPEAINAVGAIASLSKELADKLNAYAYPPAENS